MSSHRTAAWSYISMELHNNDSAAPRSGGQSDENLVGYKEAAAYLGVAVGTLYAWVSTQRIGFYRIGPRCIRFKISELRTWVETRAVTPLDRDLL